MTKEISLSFTKPILTASIIATLLFAITACNDSDTTDTTTESSDTTTSSTSTATETTDSSALACSLNSDQGTLLYCYTEELLATLSESEKSTIQIDLTESNATQYWSNLPATFVARKGIAMNEFSAESKDAAEQLLQLALSSQGETTMTELRAADEYLGNYNSSDYDADLYYLSILGTPSTTEPWLIGFTGHHYTFYVSVEGTTQSLTPNFVAVEPVEWTENGVTTTPMSDRRDAFAALLDGLSSTELANAKLSQAYDDLIAGPGNDGNFPSTAAGIAASTLSDAQKALLVTAIESYSNDAQGTGQSSAYTTDDALNETYISWASYADLATRGSYMRIDGPRVWIEFSVQNGIILSDNHYHTVWRDKTLDYGGNFAF